MKGYKEKFNQSALNQMLHGATCPVIVSVTCKWKRLTL